jgi:hypothetical protein
MPYLAVNQAALIPKKSAGVQDGKVEGRQAGIRGGAHVLDIEPHGRGIRQWEEPYRSDVKGGKGKPGLEQTAVFTAVPRASAAVFPGRWGKARRGASRRSPPGRHAPWQYRTGGRRGGARRRWTGSAGRGIVGATGAAEGERPGDIVDVGGQGILARWCYGRVQCWPRSPLPTSSEGEHRHTHGLGLSKE